MHTWIIHHHLACGVLGIGSILAGHILTAIPAYAYLRLDWSTVLSLFVHHAWIGGFFIVGAGAHDGAIYLDRSSIFVVFHRDHLPT